MSVVFVGCNDSAPHSATVPGPEINTLLPTTKGYIVVDRPPSGITAISLPTLRDTVVRPESTTNQGDIATIHALSGPDIKGRIAYIEDHSFVTDGKTPHHLLKTIKVDGTEDTEVFSRPGGAMWAASPGGHGEIGEHLAIAPVRGRVAFLSELAPLQMPSAYMNVGSVEIWDVDKKVGQKAGVSALDEGIAWFPDGQRLAYVKMAERNVVRSSGGTELSDDSFRGWERVPSVFVRDVDLGTESFLSIGWKPVVSFDGRSVLVGNLEGSWKVVDVATGKSKPANWNGVVWPGAIAYPVEDVALFWCVPTSGAKIKYTEHNSPLRGPKQMLALKLVGLKSGAFQTVLPYVDPRRVVSFGAIGNDAKD